MVVDDCMLYRNIYDIFHPSISRKNISDYKIIVNDNLIPVRIFYPDKEAKLDKIIIYIHGNKINYQVYSDIAKKTSSVVIYLEYKNTSKKDDCYNMIRYILKEIKDKKIDLKETLLMGDFIDEDLFSSFKELKDVKKLLIEPNFLVDNKYMDVVVIKDSVDNIETCKNILLFDERVSDFILNNNLMLNEKIYQVINNMVGG